MAKPSKTKTKFGKPTSFRLHPEDEAILQRLHYKLGVSPSNVFRLAIRRLAEAEGLAKKVA